MSNKESWKIYTKGGDKGETSLIGGTRVSKSDLRIEAYGTLDELNSFIGLLRDKVNDKEENLLLLKIQTCIFLLESYLAVDKPETASGLPKFDFEEIRNLEKKIDFMENELSPLANFILPGGFELNSLSHICRTICRRAERIVIALNQKQDVDEFVLQYLNRLSDFFFVYARYLSFKNNAAEVIWKTK